MQMSIVDKWKEYHDPVFDSKDRLHGYFDGSDETKKILHELDNKLEDQLTKQRKLERNASKQIKFVLESNDSHIIAVGGKVNCDR